MLIFSFPCRFRYLEREAKAIAQAIEVKQRQILHMIDASYSVYQYSGLDSVNFTCLPSALTNLKNSLIVTRIDINVHKISDLNNY